jgi:hypothetical protein
MNGFMDDSDWYNWVAFDAVHCLQELLGLDEDPSSFRSIYAILKHHPCKSTREQTGRWLATHFEHAE